VLKIPGHFKCRGGLVGSKSFAHPSTGRVSMAALARAWALSQALMVRAWWRLGRRLESAVGTPAWLVDLLNAARQAKCKLKLRESFSGQAKLGSR